MTMTVFLADDHAMVREGLRVLLNAQPDMEVVGEAADGREAVREMLRLRPHVAVIDLAMPELNGIEATRRIHAECPATRVIILSMHGDSEHVYQALKAGAYGYVLKESAAKELVAAVRVIHAGERFFTQKISNQVVADYLTHRTALEQASPLNRLTPREREVLQLVVEGKTSGEIGVITALSAKTVESYRSRLMKKLGINDVPGLVKFAIQHGLTTLE